MSAVHYLQDGNLWVACGTERDRRVTDDVRQVTCLNCEQTKQFRKDARGDGLFLSERDPRLGWRRSAK